MLARIRKSMEEKDQGFTLIELLVVMIIIGILAAVAIPVYLTQKKKANDSAVKSDLTNVAQQVETYYVDKQAYPTAADYVTITTTLIPGEVTSPGDVIQYKQQDNGYCLRGYNPNGTADGTTNWSKYFIYDTSNGGLQPGAKDSYGWSC